MPVLSASRTVLAVVPDRRRCGEIVGALQTKGIPALQAGTASQAFFWFTEEPPVLVVLDLNTKRWVTLLDRFRSAQSLVIALSDDSRLRASALEAGCIEANPATQAAEELALSVGAFLRTRSIRVAPLRSVGPLVADRSTGRLRWFDEEIEVSAHLFELAAYLVERSGEMVPTDVLLRDVWGESWASPDRVHKAVWRFRKHLGIGPDSRFLVGRRGYGYGLFPEDLSATGIRRLAFR